MLATHQYPGLSPALLDAIQRVQPLALAAAATVGCVALPHGLRAPAMPLMYAQLVALLTQAEGLQLPAQH